MAGLTPEGQEGRDDIQAARRQAARLSLVLGGLVFVAGSLVCLVYLLACKPWKLPAPPPGPDPIAIKELRP